uniref:Fibronectin type-III domain-containing protein n=1 Tax=Rhodosorus marinus TaxID=101924 RepID=A0A7S0G3N5_9RHOD|mmetsp:Transcript_1626/g.2499  ORF Transcript_1626/g.2499 Transcript_1626/m.2499 type:complete len:344 (+) Transcript_1626:85-1116(+)
MGIRSWILALCLLSVAVFGENVGASFDTTVRQATGSITILNKRQIVKPSGVKVNMQYQSSAATDIIVYITPVSSSGFNKFKKISVGAGSGQAEILLAFFNPPLQTGQFYVIRADLLQPGGDFGDAIATDLYVAKGENRPTPPTSNSLSIPPNVNRGKITGRGPYWARVSWGSTAAGTLSVRLQNGGGSVVAEKTMNVGRGYGDRLNVGPLKYSGLTSANGPYTVIAEMGGQRVEQPVFLRLYDHASLLSKYQTIPGSGSLPVKVYYVAKSDVTNGRVVRAELRNTRRRLSQAKTDVAPGPGSVTLTLTYGDLKENTNYVIRVTISNKGGRVLHTEQRGVLLEN